MFVGLINVLIFVALAGFSAGFLIGVRHWFPYEQLQGILHAIRGASAVLSPPEGAINFVIRTRSAGDVREQRQEIVDFLWKGSGFPSSILPIREPVVDARTRGIANLEATDRLTINMEFGLQSVSYYFRARQRNNRLVIYHQGHEGDFFHGREVIRSMVESGYDVMAFAMPLMGMNSRPVIKLSRHGEVKFADHDFFWFLDEEHNLCSVRYFLEPVIVALNFAETLHYDFHCMMGISGGGWATTMCAAIDPRIRYSFPTAGTLPLNLRKARELADYENHVPALYNIANFSELYVLGAAGAERKQIQILNRFDPVGWSGTRGKLYESSVQEALSRVGAGRFGVFLDESHWGHRISAAALARIHAELGTA